MRAVIGFFVVGLLMLPGEFAGAGEKTIAGKVKAVDLESHCFTVEALTADEVAGTKDSTDSATPRSLTLDVVRKTRIRIDGESAELPNIKEGQSAVVAYDEKLDVATIVSLRNLSGDDEQADLKKLQGHWIVVAEEGGNGENLDKDTLRERDRRVTITRHTMTMRRTLDSRRETFSGKFDINPANGHFDFIGKWSNGEVQEWIGIYEVKDDTWRLCYNVKINKKSVRPEIFDSAENKQSSFRTFVLKRELD